MKNILELYCNVLNRRILLSGIFLVIMLFSTGCSKKYDPTLKSRASDSDDTYLIWKKLEHFKKGDIEPQNLKITVLNKLPDRTFDEISFDGNGLITSNVNTEINYLTWYDMRQILNILYKNTWREHNNEISNNENSVIRLKIDDIQFEFIDSYGAIYPINDILEEAINESQLVRFWEHKYWFGCLIGFLLSLIFLIISWRYSKDGGGSGFFVRFFISVFILFHAFLCITSTFMMEGYPWWVRTTQILVGGLAVFISVFSIKNILFLSKVESKEISRVDGFFSSSVLVQETHYSSDEALKEGYSVLIGTSLLATVLFCFNYITSLFFY